jgi:hypothetical protein
MHVHRMTRHYAFITNAKFAHTDAQTTSKTQFNKGETAKFLPTVSSSAKTKAVTSSLLK